MFKQNVTALAVAAALGVPQAAYAATEDDLKELREQVRQLKEVYEKRIESLEKRLLQTEQPAVQPASGCRSCRALSWRRSRLPRRRGIA